MDKLVTRSVGDDASVSQPLKKKIKKKSVIFVSRYHEDNLLKNGIFLCW